MKNVSPKNIAIVAHKYVTHPDDELIAYLNKQKTKQVIHICHSFSSAPDRKSYYRWYVDGKLFKRRESKDYSFLPEPLLYLKELWFTIYWLFQTRVKWDVYIGMDGLCCLFGLFLRSLIRCKRVIFWAIDFVPKGRFDSGISNFVYRTINRISYKRVNEIWDLSPRMLEARKKYLGITIGKKQVHKVVPFGVWLNRIKTVPYEKCDKHTIVFMGHIKENQGAQLLHPVIGKLSNKYPDIRYKIIGDGPYLDELKESARQLGVEKMCDFLGRIEDHRVVEREIAKSAIAVAPYIRSLDKWTYYADPGKVKTYLACGVPVVLTDLPWNARDIEDHQCGFVCSEKTEDELTMIETLLTPKINRIFRRNARNYSHQYDYRYLFGTINL